MYTVPVPVSKFSQRTRDQIGEAIYLLGYLIHEVNWQTGRLITTQQEISDRTGFPVPTIKRWMQVLLEAGEIVARRVPGGTLISVTDYSASARTRGVKYRGPQTAGDPKPRHPKVSSAIPDKTTSDPSHGPPAIPQQTAGDPSNIDQIPNQIRVQNNIQNLLLRFTLAEGTKRLGRGPKDIFDYTHPWDRQVTEAIELAGKLSGEERAEAAVQALEQMERDRRPFVRMFVRHDAHGRLVPSGEQGEQLMLLRMADILRQRETDEQAGAEGSPLTHREQ